MCSAQIESLQSSSGQFGWYNRLLAKYGKDETHGLGYIENKDRQRAERFQPNSLYAALEPHGVIVIGGRVSGVGVGGFSLGGGTAPAFVPGT